MLRKRASEIVELVEKTECELRKDEEIPAGDIYIGCCESEGMRIIAQAARALQRTPRSVTSCSAATPRTSATGWKRACWILR